MPSSTILGQVPFTEVYVDSEIYSKAIQLKGIRVFQFSCPLFFLNKEYFKEMLFTKTLHMPFGELLKRSNLIDESQSLNIASNQAEKKTVGLDCLCDDEAPGSLANTNYGYIDENEQTITSKNSIGSTFNPQALSNQQTISSANQIRISPSFSKNNSPNHLFNFIYEADNGDERTVHTIIIDCSGISTVDSAGVRCLEEVIKDVGKIKLHCYLANCPSPLLLMFKRMRFIDRLPKNSGIFATIHDAVLHAFTRTNQLPQFIPNENSSFRSNSLQPSKSFTVKRCSYDIVNQANEVSNQSEVTKND